MWTGVSCMASRLNFWPCRKASMRLFLSTCSSPSMRKNWRYEIRLCFKIKTKLVTVTAISFTDTPPCVSFLFDRKSKYNKIQMNSPSLLSAHSVWPGKDWHLWLEVQHPSEALHPWQQHRQMVLESRGVVWRGEEGPVTAVCYRLIQSPTARLQGFTGYLSDLVCVIPLSLLRSCSTSGLAYFPPPFTAHHYV